MRVLGLDFETTGLDANEHRVIEVGAVLWEFDTGTPLQFLSNFIYQGPISEEVTKINGITEEMCEDFGRPESEVFADLWYLVGASSYVMAHNAPFDKGFYDAAKGRLVGSQVTDYDKLWLDTKIDIKYPESITTRNLRHLASEHNFLNPFSHRAVFDVLTMLKVAQCYNIGEIIARAKEPTLYVQALVSFDEKEKAKERGYYWCAPKKTWWRSFKESDYLAEKDVCGFRTVILLGPPE
jgi:DNA polymerase-3 subunit epsilon